MSNRHAEFWEKAKMQKNAGIWGLLGFREEME